MANPKNLDKRTLQELIKFIDKSPAVTWTGNGGVKERVLSLIAEIPEEDSRG